MKVRCERELSKMKHVTDKKNLKICLVGSSGGHFTPVFVAECAFGQSVLFFKCADGAVAARLSCHGEPPF